MAFTVSNNKGTNNNSTDEWFNNQFTREQFERASKEHLPKGLGNIITINDGYIIDSQHGANISQCVDIDLSKLTDKQKATLLEYLINTAITENTYRNGYLKTLLRLFVFGGWKASRISNNSTTTKKGGFKL